MPVSPENIRNFFATEINRQATLVKNYPGLIAVPIVAIASFVLPPYIMKAYESLGSAIASSPPGVAISESRERVAQATATALQTQQDNLGRDYQETGGLDLVRMSEGFLATARGSSRLAPSEAVLIDNAWARIRREGGCEPQETVILPEVRGQNPWDPIVAPRSFVIRTNCPTPQA